MSQGGTDRHCPTRSTKSSPEVEPRVQFICDESEQLRDSGGQTADWDTSESPCPDKDQRCSCCTLTDDLNTNGSWSHRSISRSLQRAEVLLRTFNPGLKWPFHGRSHTDHEEHLVVAHNLVSRSSARLLRLQQALLTVAPQWQLVAGTQTGSPQACVKGLPVEGCVLLLPSSSSSFRALWRLLEQRALLLFMHEYWKRARLASAYISSLSRLLVQQQTPFRVGLSSLTQELQVHLNHWSCLFSKVHSDPYLRPVLVEQSGLLVQIQQTLDLLGLQALVLADCYVCASVSAVAQTQYSVPKEVLEDVLAGTELYNQAVEEQRGQNSASQLRTAVLQPAHRSTLDLGLPKTRKTQTFSIKQLMVTLAVHHAETAAKQLHDWASGQSCDMCRVHLLQEASACCRRCAVSALRSGCTWEHLQHTYQLPCPVPSLSRPSLLPPGGHTCNTSLHHCPVLATPHSVLHGEQGSKKDPTGLTQTSVDPVDSIRPDMDRTTSVEPAQPVSFPGDGVHHPSAPRLSSVELLFQLLVSSSDLLVPHPTGPQGPTRTTEAAPGSSEPNRASRKLNQEEPHHERAKPDTNSSAFQKDGDGEPTLAETDGSGPHSVQRLDMGQSLLLADLLDQYRSVLWTLCSRALWLQLHVPAAGHTAASINLQDTHTCFQVLQRLSHAPPTGLVPKEFRTLLEDFSLYLLVTTAHAHWDSVMCSSLGSSLKDKCLINQGSSIMMTCRQDVMMSLTMEHFLLLAPPLLSCLVCHHTNSMWSGSCSPAPSWFTLRRLTLSRVLSSVQLSTVWVMSKAYQFLSSWSLNKFLLVSQGDLRMLRDSLEIIVLHSKSLVRKFDRQSLRQQLIRQQLETLDRSVSDLQSFSCLVLKIFSSDCKRRSGDIFERTMPSAGLWRPGHRTGFPSSPSEYASLAAQTVIGQVLEGVAPLSDDARVQALSITTTAFMEAWMEHIVKQQIKFSVQGALQLKQDFDSIREMIQSDRYGLSADLHQRLLSLRVFQQMDSAVVCLLQQPQNKPYLQSRSWEAFTRCCPANSSRDSMDAAVGSSITNLRLEGEELTLTDPSAVTSDLPPVDPSTPAEPYLAPSVALGAAQQDWLDLRIQNSARRWRLPGLQCLSKSEP
ncbi:uncharacterized protein ccdc142 isoform X1 [Embiotoca jacksoni]|uniref:uncharacterized protein ccdc142 isoform X1 n=1 Tax=Embiotoca jacksoni TaxID=100190 RepID=UPI003704BBB9